MNDDPKLIAQRKAWSFLSVLAGMGDLATRFVAWKPRKFVDAKAAKRRADRPSANPARPHSPAHIAAVFLMRAARREKRITRAENLLAEKRRRQAAQRQRHLLKTEN